MKTKTLYYFTDPGHGWVRVRRNEKLFQTIADEVSSYSYQRGNYVYLEEDDDLGLYIKAIKAAGMEIKVEQYSTNRLSKIRNYAPYEKHLGTLSEN